MKVVDLDLYLRYKYNNKSNINPRKKKCYRRYNRAFIGQFLKGQIRYSLRI